mmetsp:Transcript_72315/g.207484  ORF Transcript_72315/g.207484 Transcript_72315/m.207484 type:complete len:204 (-) Transcript_72315:368-979(-)
MQAPRRNADCKLGLSPRMTKAPSSSCCGDCLSCLACLLASLHLLLPAVLALTGLAKMAEAACRSVLATLGVEKGTWLASASPMTRRADTREINRAWGGTKRWRCQWRPGCATQHIGEAHYRPATVNERLTDHIVAKHWCWRVVVICPCHGLMLHRCHRLRCRNAELGHHWSCKRVLVAWSRRPQEMVRHVLACGCPNGRGCLC